jgi:hypothetical protein
LTVLAVAARVALRAAFVSAKTVATVLVLVLVMVVVVVIVVVTAWAARYVTGCVIDLGHADFLERWMDYS